MHFLTDIIQKLSLSHIPYSLLYLAGHFRKPINVQPDIVKLIMGFTECVTD